jgi:hypothetical protein
MEYRGFEHDYKGRRREKTKGRKECRGSGTNPSPRAYT